MSTNAGVNGLDLSFLNGKPLLLLSGWIEHEEGWNEDVRYRLDPATGLAEYISRFEAAQQRNPDMSEEQAKYAALARWITELHARREAGQTE